MSARYSFGMARRCDDSRMRCAPPSRRSRSRRMDNYDTLTREQTLSVVFETLRDCLQRGIDQQKVRVLEQLAVVATLLLDDCSPSKRRRVSQQAAQIIAQSEAMASKAN